MWAIQEMLAAEMILAFCCTRAVFMTHLLKIADLISLQLDRANFSRALREKRFLSEIEHVKPVQSLYKDILANIADAYIQSITGGIPGHQSQEPLELVPATGKIQIFDVKICTE
jgi:hypothetical protein